MSTNLKYYNSQISDFLHYHHNKFELFGLAVNVLMCLLCLALWISPTTFSADTIVSTRALLAFEFIILHSAIFMMGSKWLFVPFYFPFAYFFNLNAPDNAIMMTYMIIVLNRVRFIFMENGENLEATNAGKSIFQFFLNYFPLILVCILLEVIGLMPELGMSDETLKAMGTKKVGDVHHPTMMAFGFFYYWRAIYIDKKLNYLFDLTKSARETFNFIAILGTDIVGKKAAGKISNYLHSGILITNNPEDIKDNHTKDDLLDMTPAKWLKEYKHLRLQRPNEISEKPKMIINTLPIEEAIAMLFTLDEKNLEEVIILDLSKIEYFSNRLEIDEAASQNLSDYFPQNPIVELKTDGSCENLFYPPYFNNKKIVNLSGTDQFAIDKVKTLIHSFGWKEEKIVEYIKNEEVML